MNRGNKPQEDEALVDAKVSPPPLPVAACAGCLRNKRSLHLEPCRRIGPKDAGRSECCKLTGGVASQRLAVSMQEIPAVEVLRSELPTASPDEPPIPVQSPVLEATCRQRVSNGRATHEQLSFGYALSSWCLQIKSQTLLSLNKPPDLE
ncbi:Alpha-1,6-Mannosylglycoprotein 6-Beta-N-Acetylglucosaminyltransferase B [Manis pentadactyla]|nr:Alpha-1,6-Mannosylglycoprotein 6-Beta-N-Acetylglucosaminyltransferase B [Manis pentadactyla]